MKPFALIDSAYMLWFKKIICIVFLSVSICVNGQQVDTVINTGVYKSYFSYSIRQPLYVTYTLFKGGGDCDRNAEGFSFKPCDVETASNEDYSHFGYDKGHLANAEDFAYDCGKEALTFCYYNCLPQTRRLNRGIWKTWEGKIRTLSQTTKLFVIAGGIYSDKTIGKNRIGVPDECYKIVLNSSTKKVLYCLLFPNDNSRRVEEITLEVLKRKLHYPLVP